MKVTKEVTCESIDKFARKHPSLYEDLQRDSLIPATSDTVAQVKKRDADDASEYAARLGSGEKLAKSLQDDGLDFILDVLPEKDQASESDESGVHEDDLSEQEDNVENDSDHYTPAFESAVMHKSGDYVPPALRAA